MAINYANRMGSKIIKIGMQVGNKFTRNMTYAGQMSTFAKVYDRPPIKPELLWFKNELSADDARTLEAWMIEQLYPHLAAGNEWFHAKPEVLDFIFRDPLKTWDERGRPGYSKKITINEPESKELTLESFGLDPTEEIQINTMSAHIIKCFKKYGHISMNTCRRYIHPERMSHRGGLPVFHKSFKELIDAGVLNIIGKTQRAVTYKLISV